MTSTETRSSIQEIVSEPVSVSKLELSPQLASLAIATEPKVLSSNSQQSPVASFSQKLSNSASTNAPFQFNQPATKSQVNQPITSFTITPSKQQQNASNDHSLRSSPANVQFQFNNSTLNAPIRQPLPSFTFTSSNPNSQQGSPSHQIKETRQNNTQEISNKSSDSETPISQQASFPNIENEEPVPTPADISLLEKKLNTKLRDQTGFVIDRNDPTSPLHSLKSFEELNLKPDLLKGVYSMGFQRPSRIQEITLPHLLCNPPRNLIAQSQSGTGKTAAFSLAILSRIDPSVQISQVLILSPTYELAIQIGSVIEEMAKYLPYIRIAYAVRNSPTLDAAKLSRGQLLSEPIIIGTPGTVEDWCYRKRIVDLKKLRICCIDEADVMIATQGFQQTCASLVKHLNPNCQMMLFSATYPDEVMVFAREIITNPLVLRLKREKQALNNIRQFFIRCYESQQKYHAIEQIYSHLIIGQGMIFCRTKATARELAIRMSNDKHSVRELTAALDIDQRASIIRQFRDRVFNVLISTNVTARGIDIDDVSLVINYDMPVTVEFKPDYETYLHRIGRCGRFGKLGYTFNLIDSEKDFNTMKLIQDHFQHPIDEITINDISELEHDQE